MLRALVHKELRLALRARRVRACALVMGALAAIAALSGASAHQARVEEHQRIAGYGQSAFQSQQAAHPHTIAHNGFVVARPPAPLGFLDAGIDAAYGSWVRLDAHRTRLLQGARSIDLSRGPGGGRFDLGLLLAVFAPALVLILGYDLVAGERARGTLGMLRVAGLSPRAFAASKLTGLGIRVLLAVVLPATAAVGLASALARQPPTLRLLAWLGVHLLALAVWTVIGCWASALAGTPRTALLGGLALWGGLALLLPPLAGASATVLAPLPALGKELVQAERWAASAHAQDEALRQRAIRDIQRRHPAWDGGGEAPEVVDAVMLRLADAEVAAKVSALFDGLAAEDDRQERWAVWASTLSPTGLASLASSAVAGSDLAHMRAFFRHFESYRVELMAWLNDWWARNGRGGFERQDQERAFDAFQDAPRVKPLALGLSFALSRAARPLALLLLIGAASTLGLLLPQAERRWLEATPRSGA